MIRPNRRERYRLIRQAVENMPPSGLERMVSLRYMHNYTDMDIREEMCITKRVLADTKDRIRKILISVGVGVVTPNGKQD